jgi:hypothetical protein
MVLNGGNSIAIFEVELIVRLPLLVMIMMGIPLQLYMVIVKQEVRI